VRSLAGVGLKIERLAKQQDGQSIGATIASILSGKDPRAPVSDEVLSHTKVGRLLIQRRQRAEADYPG
jgi:hypothetical protein